MKQTNFQSLTIDETPQSHYWWDSDFCKCLFLLNISIFPYIYQKIRDLLMQNRYAILKLACYAQGGIRLG